MTIWPLQRDCPNYYGNPDPNGDGVPDRAWEDANLTRITPPYRMVLAWDTGTPVKTIRVHKKCALSLSSILVAVATHYGSQEAIEAARMHLYGGCYNFRLMRGGVRLSMHSYACAIDLDPEKNPLGKKWREGMGMMPRPVIDAFKAEGWEWGGNWSNPDAQHFQAARVAQ